LGGEKPDRGLLTRMTILLTHRGPDDEGSFAEGAFAAGFRRLAILDLAPSGRQPMLSADERYVIVFNGAIFNYVELREELTARGHVFRSSGDTEVLLAAYQEWGEGCLGRLNGMWAFLIYDRASRRLFGARDRFGVKPLYTYRDARQLMFASEIKAIRDSGAVRLSPDRQTIARFLLDNRLDDSERTFYAGVTQIGAGTAFEVDEAGRLRSWSYWSLRREQDTGADPVADYRDLFDDAIRLRMRSDVPVGVQLSGGLDSTSIVCRMAQRWVADGRAAEDLRAFCYLSPDFDETAQIDATLRQTRIRQVPLEAQPGELWSSVERHLWHQDEPVHSFTSVVGYKLMELARSHDVRVLLNGQGADEVLAGYGNYFFDYWSDLVRSGRLRSAQREIAEFAAADGRSRREIHMHVLSRAARQILARVPGYASLARARSRARVEASPWVSAELKSHWAQGRDADARSLDAALRSSVEVSPLPLYLRVEDRNSMAHGVEVRLPFLDYRLVNLAFATGPEWKLKGPCSKRLLREAMNGRIPEEVRAQYRKYGFPTSAASWFRGPLYEPIRDLLASQVVRESGLWNHDTVTDALEQHRRGEHCHGARLFDVAQLSLWVEGSRNWPGAAVPPGSASPPD
jgi:asparagine synthase (glutamine-hydrolysing)